MVSHVTPTSNQASIKFISQKFDFDFICKTQNKTAARVKNSDLKKIKFYFTSHMFNSNSGIFSSAARIWLTFPLFKKKKQGKMKFDLILIYLNPLSWTPTLFSFYSRQLHSLRRVLQKFSQRGRHVDRARQFPRLQAIPLRVLRQALLPQWRTAASRTHLLEIPNPRMNQARHSASLGAEVIKIHLRAATFLIIRTY